MPLREGEHRMTLAMPAGLHAVGADGQGHRRLPLLPARPRPGQGRVADRQQRAARQPRRRAPRDPLPALARPGRGGRAEGRADRRARAGPASAAPGSRASSPTSTTPPGWPPGRPVVTRPRSARATASASQAGSRIVMQVHYNLLKGAAPDVSSTQLRWMDGDRDLTAAAHLPDAGAGGDAVPPGPRRRRRCATATPPSPT